MSELIEVVLNHPHGRTDLVSHHEDENETTYSLKGAHIDRQTLVLLAVSILRDFTTEEEMEELGIYL